MTAKKLPKVAPAAPLEDDDEYETIEEYTAEEYLEDRYLLLPSGKHIRIRPLSLVSLIRNGDLPKPLVAAAKRALGFGGSGRAAPTDADIDTSLKLTDTLVCLMIASFPVVDKPASDCAAGEVPVSRIFDADKTAIFNYAMQGQTALTDFRPE